MRSSFIIKNGSAAAIIALLIASCTKDVKVDRQVGVDLSNKAMVQVYNATVGSGGSLIGVDGAPVNGTTAMSYGSAFPTTTYFAADPGTHNFLIKASAATSVQAPLSFQTAFQANTYYNVFTYDTITSPKFVVVPTTIVVPVDSTARVRFANFMYSKTSSPNIDIYSFKRKANVFTNVAANTVTDFIAYASALNDTLSVRETGTTTALGQLNGFNPGKKRTYTLVLRGRYQTTTGTIARTMSTLVNY